MAQRNRTIVITIIVLAAGIIMISAYFSSEPLGQFHSYSLSPHDKTDVVSFDNGKVMWHTTCGSESWGSYGLNEAGEWIWEWPVGAKTNRFTNIFVLSPGPYALRLFETNSGTTFHFRRRLTRAYPF